MANLNSNEKELLAVIQYYGEQRKAVSRLVAKLHSSFGMETVQFMTKLPTREINALLEIAPKRKTKGNAIKAIGNAKKAPAKLNKAAKEIAAAESLPAEVDAEFVKQGHTRLAIHLNSESDLVTRIASDITRAIESELKPGDKLWASRVIIDRFGARSNIVPTINKILMDHNWIEQVQSGNPRKGYVVK